MKITLFFFILPFSGFGQSSPLPLSEIDIPIRINLRPIFAMAEKRVDTVFTSPGYPAAWVQQGCDTRYKYRFRRSPLRMKAVGTKLELGFTGYYSIVGAKRVCAGSTVLSPWSPDFSCGLGEPERRVQVGFTAQFALGADYLLRTLINRSEPQALDKCGMSMFNYDVTGVVISSLKSELDLSRKALTDSFGAVALRPYLQQAWTKLATVYNVPGIGYFALNPTKLRMEGLGASGDWLNLSIGLTAQPVVSFLHPGAKPTLVPNMSGGANREGFNLFLQSALRWDSLSTVMTAFAKGKKFTVSDGLIKKHVTMEKLTASADSNGRLKVVVDFAGSHRGTMTLLGRPVYNPATQTIEIADLTYDLQTKDILLKTAKWLFNKKILDELKAYTSIPLKDHYAKATTALNGWLNREWTKGVKSTGSVSDLKVHAVQALSDHLLLQTSCTGKLGITVSDIVL